MNKNSEEPPPRRKIWWVIPLGFSPLLILAGYAVFSPVWGPRLLCWGVSKVIPARVSFKRLEGTVARGFSARGVVVKNFSGLPEQLSLSIKECSLRPRGRFKRRETFLLARDLRIASPWFEASISEVDSPDGKTFNLRGIRVEAIRRLPRTSRLEIPHLKLVVASFSHFREKHQIEVANARLSLPLSRLDFAGRSTNGRLETRILPSSIHLMDIAYLFPSFRKVQPWGKVDLEGDIKGQLSRFQIRLELSCEAVTIGCLDLNTGKALADLTLESFLTRPTLTGVARLIAGKLRAGKSQLTPESARLLFRGRHPIDPELDLVLKGHIGGYNILVRGQGALRHPRLEMESSPPLDETQIALLITTGKTRTSLKTGDEEETGREDIVSDLLGYLLGQPRGDESGSRPGVEIADVVYDPESGKKGALVRKSWGKKFATLYGLALQPHHTNHTLGLEYNIDASITIGGKREFRDDGEGGFETGGEDKVYLKWKKEF